MDKRGGIPVRSACFEGLLLQSQFIKREVTGRASRFLYLTLGGINFAPVCSFGS